MFLVIGASNPPPAIAIKSRAVGVFSVDLIVKIQSREISCVRSIFSFIKAIVKKRELSLKKENSIFIFK